jgi:hypothetical protein
MVNLDNTHISTPRYIGQGEKNAMNTTTYITDTNHDPHTHYILDEHNQSDDTYLRFWFEGEDVLPGDEITDFREALIRATVRLNGEDREFLASNGFVLTTIPMVWNENNLTFPPSIMLVDVLREMNKACLKYKVTHNNRPYDVLSVLEHMGSDIISVIKPLGCKIKDKQRY